MKPIARAPALLAGTLLDSAGSDEQKKKILRQLNVIVLAQNRRVDVRLNGSEQESALHYPFNAADSATLLDLKKPVSKTTKAAPKNK